MMPSQGRLDAVARHVLGGGTILAPQGASSGEAFAVVEESYEDSLGRSVRVMQLRNNDSSELAEVLLNTPGGQNRSTGSGSVGGQSGQGMGTCDVSTADSLGKHG